MKLFDMFRRDPAAAASSASPSADAESFWGYALSDPGLAGFMRGAGGDTAAGAVVTPDTALRNMAVFRCVDLISSTIGSLPLRVIKEDDAGRITRAEDHPLYDLLMYQPNSFQSPFDFKAQMQNRALIEGDGFALVVRSRGKILQLVPLDPIRMSWRQNDDWTITYQYRKPSGGQVDYGQTDILHLRGMSRDGVSGLSRVNLAREAIATALQAEKAAARLFKLGLLAGGMLTHPKTLSDGAIARLKAQIESRGGADQAGKWLVGEEGLDMKPMPTTARDSQHVEQRRMQIEEVARAFGVPRPLLMMDDTSWGSGIEQLGILFVRFGLSTWFKVWEEAIARTCLTLPERRAGYQVDFDERELLRGSMADQGDFYAKALGAGGQRPWMTQNEVRDVTGQGHSDDPEADKLTNPMTQGMGSQKDANNAPG